MNSVAEAKKNDDTTVSADQARAPMPWKREWPLTAQGRSKFGIDPTGWLANPGLGRPSPCDIPEDLDDELDGYARDLLVYLGEARACMERLHGFWMDRDATYPGDAEIAALLSRHAVALHHVTTHLEILREEWKKLEATAPSARGAVKESTPVPETMSVALDRRPYVLVDLEKRAVHAITVADNGTSLVEATTQKQLAKAAKIIAQERGS